MFHYPSGKYCVQSSEHWGVGIVRKPFELNHCAFGSATSRARDVSASELILAEPDAGSEAQLDSDARIDYVVISKARFTANLPSGLKATGRMCFPDGLERRPAKFA
ncbi:MAG: hypothetical protein AAFQ05_00470 [Pseudomonadota bacterium]